MSVVRPSRLLSVLIVGLLVLAACSSDGGSTEGDTETEAPDTEAATGEPIIIGTYTPADNPTFTAPEMIPAAEAAVEYVNNELDGIGGRPIQLESCTTDYTPESLTACGNELFEKDPLIIMPGPDAAAFTVLSTFTETGIPLIGGASFTPPEFSSGRRAMFNGWSVALFSGMVHFAIAELGAEKLTAVTFDDGTNPIIFDLFMAPIAEANGVDVELVTAPVGSPDLTAPLASVLETDPDVVLAYGLPCAPVMQGYASLGSDVPMILPSNCNDPDTLDEAGDAAEGVYFINQFLQPNIDPDDPDVQLYVEKIDQYGSGDIDETEFSFTGFGSILNIRDILEGLDLETATPDDILAAFLSAVDQHNFMSEPYTCDPAPLEQYPAVCNASARMSQVQDGELVEVVPFTSAQVLTGVG